MSWIAVEEGGILVGADGRRFGNEDAGYFGYPPVVMGEGEFAWTVYDHRVDEACLEEEYPEMAAMGGGRRVLVGQ